MTDNYIPKFISVQKEGLKLFKQKNKDYGNAFANHGPIVVIIRMGDKINRLMNVSQSGVNMIKTESLRDTLIDLHNYSAMAIMLMDSKEKLQHPQVQKVKNLV